MAVNMKHCSVKPDTKPCWVCLHGALCIGGLYCMKHKRYVQYQDVAECEDKEIA